jgi:hypothetical protein
LGALIYRKGHLASLPTQNGQSGVQVLKEILQTELPKLLAGFPIWAGFRDELPNSALSYTFDPSKSSSCVQRLKNGDADK